MPISERDEPEESRAEAAGLLEYIDRRRLHQARQRRQRLLVAAIATLGLVAAMLAVSNMILLKRLSTRAQTPPPAAVATAPPASPAPARPTETSPRPTEMSPPPAAPAPPAPAAATTTAPPQTRAPAPASPPTAPIPPPVPTAPPAASAPTPPTASAPPVAASAPAAADGDAAQRTARWMVETHGRIEAENRAARVAEFYTGDERAFWRRVLLNVRQEPR
jgi:outer membrane biosynthesis protein TonB